MALVGCTQMATDTAGLLQRMLRRLDATHMAVCIAVSKLFETSPENRNHSQAFGCCQPCLPCMTDLVLPRLQTCQRILMEMEEKKNTNTTRDMFKMALAVEYMKAILSDACWIHAVCEAHNVVDRLHIQSKTVVCQRGVKPLNAVEAVQNLLREFQRLYCMGSLRRRNILAS